MLLTAGTAGCGLVLVLVKAVRRSNDSVGKQIVYRNRVDGENKVDEAEDYAEIDYQQQML